ncbi:glycosyltransferase family 4 protein [Vibrio ulleungensis]|uniref:Glycosyltransferase family 4 protein n=1 Tax=Vibrio ulleungensis TaxID=2807619 RepID=A0ABS2HFE2_9VIBR|nr:glycosyltransferase family 4 protein [Vibrio ulleungensis]MBM7036283.1 glycosyltransferase family 4 protein [Vibrio ulleungensis]
MRIAHVVRQFYPAIGGLENFVLDLAKEQVKQGMDVKVVTLNRRYDTNQSLDAEERVFGLDIVRIPFVGSHRYPIAPSVLKHLNDVDVIHVHAVDFFIDYISLNKFRLKTPIVLSTHGGFFHTKFAANLKKLFFNTVTRFSLRSVDQVITCSSNDHKIFERLYPHKTLLIENGVNTEKFAKFKNDSTNKQILFIGRFSDNKRVDLLIQWFSQLNQLDNQFKLVIAGKDWDNNYHKLKQQVIDLDLVSKVEFVIEASEDELAQVVSQSSFIASASEYEGFGMTIIESMAGGLIPLMSNIDSFVTINNKTQCGMLIDFNSTVSVNEFIKSINFDDLVGEKSRCIAQSQLYSFSKKSADFTQVYSTLSTHS